MDGIAPIPRALLGYGTILIDFPWPTGKGNKGWMNRMSKRPYPTMSIRQIRGMAPELDAIAAKDAVVLMWTTWGNLAVTIDVMRAARFGFATGMPWLKVVQHRGAPYAKGIIPAPIYGPGVWFQHCTELLLIGRRGSPFGKLGNPRPARKGIIIHPRLEHSKKPSEVHEWVESKQANFPRPWIELFAREKRAGWTVWGNEV